MRTSMETPRASAERIISILKKAIAKDPVVADLYYDFSFDIVNEADGCFVPVTDYSMAWCKNDGSISIVAAQGTPPIVGEIPVLTPLTQESLTLAILYAVNVRKLREKQADQFILRKLSGKDFDDEGGLVC